MPDSHTRSALLSLHAGDWLLLWRSPSPWAMLTLDEWSAQSFSSKSRLALEAWRRWGEPGAELKRGPGRAGALCRLPPSRALGRYEEPTPWTEIMAVSAGGLELSVWPLIDFGAQLADELDQPGSWERRYRSRPSWIHPFWNGNGPVPGTGKGGRQWRSRRHLRLGSGARKNWASDISVALADLRGPDAVISAPLGPAIARLIRARGECLADTLAGPEDQPWRERGGRGRKPARQKGGVKLSRAWSEPVEG